jgi:hypothetical protein
MFGIAAKAILVGGAVAAVTFVSVKIIQKSNAKFEAELAEERAVMISAWKTYFEKLTAIDAALEKSVANAKFWDIVTREG